MEFDCIIHDSQRAPVVSAPEVGTPGMIRVAFEDVQHIGGADPRSVEVMMYSRDARALRDALNAANLEDAPRPA